MNLETQDQKTIKKSELPIWLRLTFALITAFIGTLLLYSTIEYHSRVKVVDNAGVVILDSFGTGAGLFLIMSALAILINKRLYVYIGMILFIIGFVLMGIINS